MGQSQSLPVPPPTDPSGRFQARAAFGELSQPLDGGSAILGGTGVPIIHPTIEIQQPSLANDIMRQFKIRAPNNSIKRLIIHLIHVNDFPTPDAPAEQCRLWIIEVLKLYGAPHSICFLAFLHNLPQTQPLFAFMGENGLEELKAFLKPAIPLVDETKCHAIASAIRSCLFIKTFLMMGASWGVYYTLNEHDGMLNMEFPAPARAETPFMSQLPPWPTPHQIDEPPIAHSKIGRLNLWQRFELKETAVKWQTALKRIGSEKDGEPEGPAKKKRRKLEPGSRVYTNLKGRFMVVKDGQMEEIDMSEPTEQARIRAIKSPMIMPRDASHAYVVGMGYMCQDLPKDRNIVVWTKVIQDGKAPGILAQRLFEA